MSALDDPLGFVDDQQLIAGQISECLFESGWPGNFNTVNLCRRAKSEMQTRVVLRIITPSAHHFVNLRAPTRRHSYPGTNGGAIRTRPYALDSDPVVLISPFVAQKRRRTVEVVNHDVHVAIIIEVAEGAAASQIFGLNRRTGHS